MKPLPSWIAAMLVVLTLPVHSDPPSAPAFSAEMVKVPGANYWVAKYEVTQAQYEEVTGENPSASPNPLQPVDSVSWEDAVAFCEKLTVRERAVARLRADQCFDLPTDAQWDQFAAGSDLKDAATSLVTSQTGTTVVGSHTPNPLGLYDVVGNVWEWCRDWYNNDIRKRDTNKDMPYVLSDAEVAAQGPEETFKVLRGGAWDTGPADGFTLASRLRYAPSMSNRRTGFRVVMVPISAFQVTPAAVGTTGGAADNKASPSARPPRPR